MSAGIATVTRQGQITIPLWVRRQCAVQPGDRVIWKVLPGRRGLMQFVPTRNVVEKLAGSLGAKLK